jgi:DNA-binding beta-propeller fold protein YncE
MSCGGGGGGSPYTPPPVTPPTNTLNTTAVAVSAVKMVYDSSRKRIYATVDGSDLSHPNSVAIVDANTLSLITTIPIGDTPRVVRLSDDYRNLYVGVDETGEVKKIDLATNTVVASFSLGPDGNFGKIMPGDIAVMPGHPDTVAVAWRYQGLANNGGVAIYDSGVRRPVTSSPYFIGGPDVITFGTTPDTIYAANTSVSDFSLIRMTVAAEGVTVKDSKGSMFGFGYYFDMLFDSGRLYSTSGAVADPYGMKLLGRFDGGGMSMTVDSVTATASFLPATFTTSSGIKKEISIYQFDTSTFLSKGFFTAEVPATTQGFFELLQCGTGTLAFITSDGTTKSIRVIKGAATPPANKTPTMDTLATNHIVYDPLRQKIYASVPSRVGSRGNSVAVIDPLTKVIDSFIYIGSEPNVLALSGDSRYLYVGVDGAAGIARLDLNTKIVDLQYPLALPPAPWRGAPLGALYISVLPNDSRSVIVSAKYLDGRSPYYAGMLVYDDGVLRTSLPDVWVGESIALNEAGTTVYGSNDMDEIRAYTMDGNGFTYQRNYPYVSRTNKATIQYVGGDIYTTTGRRLDPNRPKLKGTYPWGIARGMVVDDKTVYALGDTTSGKTAIFAFDRDKYLYTSYLVTSLPSHSGFDFMKCGSIGFAFATSSGVVVVGNAFTPTASVGTNATNLAASHLLYDKDRSVIYASVPSRAGDVGNSVATINPVTHTIVSSVFVGSEPGPMTMSRDGSLLYVGLDGSGSVAVVDLATHTVQSYVDVPFDKQEGQHFAYDLAVKPDDPNVLALLKRRAWGWSPEYAGLTIYDHGQPRAGELPAFGYDIGSIVFGASTSEFYGYDNWDTGFYYYKLNLDNSGVTLQKEYSGLISGFLATLSYYDGMLYTTNGYSIDPLTDSPTGRFPGAGSGTGIANDPQRSYFPIWDVTANPKGSVKVYDRTTYALVGSFGVPQATGTPYDPIRYGSSGLAFATEDDHIVFTDVPQITGSDVPLSQLPVNRMVYDSSRQRIYAAVPGSSTARGNTITVIDPATTTIERSIKIGSEPNELALSANGQYLYVGLLGANAIKRIDLNTSTVDESISTGWGSSGATFARSISANPTDPNVIAVSKVYQNIGPASESTSIFNGTIELPNVIRKREGNPDVITYGNLSSTLYGFDLTSSDHNFYVMTADDTGITGIDSARNATLFGRILFSGGLVYSSTGAVVDPATKSVKLNFALAYPGDVMALDAAAGRAVFVEHDWNSGQARVQAFDIANGQMTTNLDLPQGTAVATDIVRWGPKQYAISTKSGIILMNGNVQ